MTEEISKATNIKDKNNRHNVEDALTYALESLKSCNITKSPKNGLVIFTGID